MERRSYNMKKAFNFKIIAFLGLLFSLFLCVGPTAQAEIATTKPTWDPSIYNTEWIQANVKYWVYKFGVSWYNPFSWNYAWDDRTVSCIRITDQKGNFINDVTRLEASYIIGGKQYWVNEELDDQYLNKSGFIHEDERGHFTSYDYYWGKIDYSTTIFKHDRLKKEFKDYELCNYIWDWSYDVYDIVYLYIWYLDPETGKEVAGSFMPDGAHPLYDENGVLKGIYDVDGNPLDDYSLGADGIIEDETGKDIITSDDQKVEEIRKESTIFKYINIFQKTSEGISDGLRLACYVIFYIVVAIICVLIIFGLYKGGKKLVKWVRK